MKNLAEEAWDKRVIGAAAISSVRIFIILFLIHKIHKQRKRSNAISLVRLSL